MKNFMLMQYFMTAMVLTISVGLFTLKPIANQQVTTTAQISTVIVNDQSEIME